MVEILLLPNPNQTLLFPFLVYFPFSFKNVCISSQAYKIEIYLITSSGTNTVIKFI